MTMRVADWVMTRLVQEGIGHVFVLPGGGAMHLNDALACEPKLKAVPCQHEQACGIAAEAYGRTGRLGAPRFGVAMVTTGPGATNAVTPVAGAWIDSIPLLVISGQAKRADLLSGRALRQTGVQEVDIVSVVKPITKLATLVREPIAIRAALEEALHAMLDGRPGPVWLDIPLDVQAAPIEPDSLPAWGGPAPDRVESGGHGSRAAPSTTSLLDDVIDRLLNAQRPLILAGHGVRLAEAGAELSEFAHRLGVPCVFTWNAMDLMAHNDPLNIGRPGVVATRAANFAVQNADLLICVGARLDPVVTGYNRNQFGRNAKKILVDIDADELIDKQDVPDALAVQMDASEFIIGLLQRAKGQGQLAIGDWRDRCCQWKVRYPLHKGEEFPLRGPISHAHFVSAFSEAAPSNTLIATGSSGLAIEFFYAGFRNKEGQRLFLTSGLGAMGFGLPAALGACLALGREPCLAVESDGSLQLNIQELATMSAQALPICLFVMNNAGYASIRNTQRNYFNGRYLGSNADSGLVMPDLGAVARAYGVGHTVITDCGDLTEQLARAMQIPRPCIVDVRLVAEEALQPKCAAIPQPDGGMLSMPLEDMSPLLSLEEMQREMLAPLAAASLKARGLVC